MLGQRFVASLTGLLALGSGLGLALAPSASAAAPTNLVSLSVTPTTVNTTTVNTTTVDTTTGDARVTVRARVTDADGISGFGVEALHVSTPSAPQVGIWDAYPVGSAGTSILIPRVSGTAQDGIYQADLLVPRSTSGVLALDAVALDGSDTGVRWTSADLRALGVTAQFSATSTQQPPMLSNLKGRSLTGTGTVGGIPVITRTGVITFSIGTGYAYGIQVVKSSGCADGLPEYYPASTTITFGGRLYAPCTIQLRAFNGLALGPISTLVYL